MNDPTGQESRNAEHAESMRAGGDGRAYDAISRPCHYIDHPSGVECIDVASWLGFNLGNAFKYLFRRNAKGDLRENLEKALWYLDRESKRTDVWFEEVPEGAIARLKAKATLVIGWEPSFVGSAMSRIVAAAVGDKGCDAEAMLAEASEYVRAEIKRVCE